MNLDARDFDATFFMQKSAKPDIPYTADGHSGNSGWPGL